MAKLGIMSFAHMHAESYAACVNQLPEAELAAIWDDDPIRGREAADRHHTRFIGSIDEFLASPIEGVIITSENIKHRELAEWAAAAGKWILSEKPLATTIEDARAMIDTAQKAKVGLGTAFPCRYAPTLVAVKEQIASGLYGAIYAASCTNNGQFPGGWFADPAQAGGGATMDHTVHVADLLRWMTGKEFTRVYCENGHLLGRPTSLDDVGCLHFEMEDGIIASHIASWNRPACFPTWGDITLELIGEKGVVAVDAFNQKVSVYNDNVMRNQWVNWGGNMDLALVADFNAAVQERREPTVTGLDGLKSVEVTVAAYQSPATGKPAAIGS